MPIQNTLDKVSYNSGGYFSRRITDDPGRSGYSLWKDPTSNESGYQYLRKKDEATGLEYLYDRSVSKVPIMTSEPMTGNQIQATSPSIFGTGGEPLFQTQVSYNKVKIAPGQGTADTRQPEAPRRRGSLQTLGGGGSSAVRAVGKQGTILTGSRGVKSGQAAKRGKSQTLLGA